jgi:hypothetical protein
LPDCRSTGRSNTDLLAIQGGVTPITTSDAGNSTPGGVRLRARSRKQQYRAVLDQWPERIRERFLSEWRTVQETIGQQAGIIPNLDSIAEFRILTSNADAEYGGYSGRIINVITKSGGNNLHGQPSNSCATPILTQAVSFLPSARRFSKTSSAERSAARS